jgi:hypothetical protein
LFKITMKFPQRHGYGGRHAVELHVEREWQGVCPESAHLPGNRQLIAKQLHHQVIKNLYLLISDFENRQVKSVWLPRPALKPVGPVSHEFPAEPAVGVIVVKRP